MAHLLFEINSSLGFDPRRQVVANIVDGLTRCVVVCLPICRLDFVAVLCCFSVSLLVVTRKDISIIIKGCFLTSKSTDTDAFTTPSKLSITNLLCQGSVRAIASQKGKIGSFTSLSEMLAHYKKTDVSHRQSKNVILN